MNEKPTFGDLFNKKDIQKKELEKLGYTVLGFDEKGEAIIEKDKDDNPIIDEKKINVDPYSEKSGFAEQGVEVLSPEEMRGFEEAGVESAFDQEGFGVFVNEDGEFYILDESGEIILLNEDYQEIDSGIREPRELSEEELQKELKKDKEKEEAWKSLKRKDQRMLTEEEAIGAKKIKSLLESEDIKSNKNNPEVQKSIKEIMKNSPVSFAEAIKGKVLSMKIKWEKEEYKDKKGKTHQGTTSYFPTKGKDWTVKFIFNQAPNKEGSQTTEKIFAQGYFKVNENKVIVFCAEVKKFSSAKEKKGGKGKKPYFSKSKKNKSSR